MNEHIRLWTGILSNWYSLCDACSPSTWPAPPAYYDGLPFQAHSVICRTQVVISDASLLADLEWISIAREESRYVANIAMNVWLSIQECCGFMLHEMWCSTHLKEDHLTQWLLVGVEQACVYSVQTVLENGRIVPAVFRNERNEDGTVYICQCILHAPQW